MMEAIWPSWAWGRAVGSSWMFWRRCPRRENCSGVKTFGCREGNQPFVWGYWSHFWVLILSLENYREAFSFLFNSLLLFVRYGCIEAFGFECLLVILCTPFLLVNFSWIVSVSRCNAPGFKARAIRGNRNTILNKIKYSYKIIINITLLEYYYLKKKKKMLVYNNLIKIQLHNLCSSQAV